MSVSFNTTVKSLKKTTGIFNEAANLQRVMLLKRLSKTKLHTDKSLLHYFEILLFIAAHPFDKRDVALCKGELLRLTNFLKNASDNKKEQFTNSGLPFTKYVSCFSHDLVRWLLVHPACKIELSTFKQATFTLNDILALTLPSLEKSETTAGLNNDELIAALQVDKKDRLQFLMNELGKLDALPSIKDFLYDALGVYTSITPRTQSFSRAYNRVPVSRLYFHTELIKQFNFSEVLNNPLPDTIPLSEGQRENYVLVIKNSMALTDRETDPITYLDRKTLKVFQLDRGISVALYGMLPQRQLPLESYVGYTLFKNGYPAAYGGAWLFGEVANFGINIFESFRGGESGYILCQLLRVYKQEFEVKYFEIEAYQFGLDNPEGIASGAFWFYYRFGFRPLDKVLLKLSLEEHKKIKSREGYRTSKKLLIGFTESNMALNLGNGIPIKVPDITTKVTEMIANQYKGERIKAVEVCVNSFCRKVGVKRELNISEKQVLQEVALWAEALKIDEERKLKLLAQMVEVKPVDLYKYQKLLLQFFND